MPAKNTDEAKLEPYHDFATDSIQRTVVAEQFRVADELFRHRALARQIFKNVFDALVRHVGRGFEQTDERFHGLA